MNALVPETQGREPNRRWLQFSLRSLLLFVLMVSIACSWFAVRLRKAEKQKAAVAAFEKAGGFVRYDFDPGDPSDPFYRSRRLDLDPPYPAWLVKQLGIDFFADATGAVYFPWELTVMNCSGPPPPLPPNFDFDILTRLPRLQALTVFIRDSGDFEKIARLVQIGHLNIIANGYGDENLAHLRALVRLRSISLFGFTIQSGLQHLAALLQLSEMRLSACRFASSDMVPAVRLGQIEELDFDRTYDVNVALTWVKDSPRLRRLRISHGDMSEDCELKQAGMEIIVSLPHLEELELSRLVIEETAISQLGKMRQLRRLAIPYSKIHDADLKQLQDLKQLEQLDLSYNPINGEGLDHLKGLPRLRSLIFFGPITDLQAQKLCTLCRSGKRV
jgi:hypothetical protein